MKKEIIKINIVSGGGKTSCKSSSYRIGLVKNIFSNINLYVSLAHTCVKM